MDQELFAHINLPAERGHIPDGNAPDLEGECARYDRKIAEAGGIDLQLLGILAATGTSGFNEPSDQFVYGCHVVITQSTIEAGRRFFDREEDVPRRAVSLGVGSIMNASVLLIATGSDKADAVRKAILEDIDPGTQASILRTHPNAIFLLDRAAASRL